MKYSSSIHSLLNYFKDNSLWKLNQYSNELKNYRQDCSGQWDDRVANDINNQYLNPHVEDETEMQSWLGRQYESTVQLTTKLDEIERVNNEILSLSAEIQKLLNDCEGDLRKAITNFDFSYNAKNEAESKINNIIHLLNLANQGEFSVNY